MPRFRRPESTGCSEQADAGTRQMKLCLHGSEIDKRGANWATVLADHSPTGFPLAQRATRYENLGGGVQTRIRCLRREPLKPTHPRYSERITHSEPPLSPASASLPAETVRAFYIVVRHPLLLPSDWHLALAGERRKTASLILAGHASLPTFAISHSLLHYYYYYYYSRRGRRGRRVIDWLFVRASCVMMAT